MGRWQAARWTDTQAKVDSFPGVGTGTADVAWSWFHVNRFPHPAPGRSTDSSWAGFSPRELLLLTSTPPPPAGDVGHLSSLTGDHGNPAPPELSVAGLPSGGQGQARPGPSGQLDGSTFWAGSALCTGHPREHSQGRDSLCLGHAAADALLSPNTCLHLHNFSHLLVFIKYSEHMSPRGGSQCRVLLSALS